MSLFGRSHYDYLREVLPDFFKAIGINPEFAEGIEVAHGDKCYSYRDAWEAAGIHFYHGCAIFMVSYCQPYSKEVRQTESGWVAPKDWVIANKDRFLPHLPPAV